MTRSTKRPRRWRGLRMKSFIPIPENQAVYEELYAEYLRLHDYFGRGENDVMKRLKRIKADARS